MKDDQATGEAFIPQKRPSSTSKHEISTLSIYSVILPSWIRILIRIHNAAGSKSTQINADLDLRQQHWLKQCIGICNK